MLFALLNNIKRDLRAGGENLHLSKLEYKIEMRVRGANRVGKLLVRLEELKLGKSSRLVPINPSFSLHN